MELVKKGLILALSSFLFMNLAFGDEIDDQIKKLEKEKARLNENNPENQSVNNNKVKVKTKKPESKNGFFLGVEGDLGGSDMTVLGKAQLIRSDKATPEYDHATLYQKSTTFDAGLVGGYQHYFGESQRHGIKVSAHIYSGFGNSWVVNKNKSAFNTLSYVPIKAGLDIKYLWDFLQKGKHTLGLNVGFGYQFNAYVDGKDVWKSYPGEKTTLESEPDKHNNIYENEFYPVIGLHYYYGHHQFELMYRFGGIWDHSGREHEQSTDSGTANEGLATSFTYKETLDADLIIHTASYLSFNYTYRF
ncbi:outer membrane beta-barrel protein [Helicobacter sp. 13S00477-4]|uniref:outer membrane beta-barrel protein n=1 Tax=Helicobacter sp. 13S00477-4 TaxID=1905759 RepID=UPI000BA7CD0D|nr:outer membrane beta-barrel protein [Helicobacter sp. 13S00477-4]PAF52576.1 hypothetical protein BKH44_02025 [Helicobacter sp. 13S00477-4]